MHVNCSYLVLPAMGLTAFRPRSGMFPKKLRFPRINCLKFVLSASSFATVVAAVCFVAAGLTGVFLSLDVAIFLDSPWKMGRRRSQDPCHPLGFGPQYQGLCRPRGVGGECVLPAETTNLDESSPAFRRSFGGR